MRRADEYEEWWQTVGQYAAEPPAWTRLYMNKDKHMNFDDLYPSKYLKQSDVGDGEVTVTIEGVKKVNMAKDGAEPEYKPVVKFREFDKPMAMNKTNGRRIAELYGREIDQWRGKQMILYVNPDVQFGDETVGGLRLKAPVRSAPKRMNDDDFNSAMSGRDDDDKPIPF